MRQFRIARTTGRKQRGKGSHQKLKFCWGLRWIMEEQEQPSSSGEIPEPREGDTLRLRGELPVHHQQDVDLPPWCAAVRRRRLLPAGN